MESLAAAHWPLPRRRPEIVRLAVSARYRAHHWLADVYWQGHNSSHDGQQPHAIRDRRPFRLAMTKLQSEELSQSAMNAAT